MVQIFFGLALQQHTGLDTFLVVARRAGGGHCSALSLTPSSPVCHPVIIIHHPQNGGLQRESNREHYHFPFIHSSSSSSSTHLIRGVHRCHTNVAHCPEATAVVQMLVLQPKVVPHEPPKHLQRRQNRKHYLPLKVLVRGHGQCPAKAQDKVLHNGKVVEFLQETRG